MGCVQQVQHRGLAARVVGGAQQPGVAFAALAGLGHDDVFFSHRVRAVVVALRAARLDVQDLHAVQQRVAAARIRHPGSARHQPAGAFADAARVDARKLHRARHGLLAGPSVAHVQCGHLQAHGAGGLHLAAHQRHGGAIKKPGVRRADVAQHDAAVGCFMGIAHMEHHLRRQLEHAAPADVGLLHHQHAQRLAGLHGKAPRSVTRWLAEVE